MARVALAAGAAAQLVVDAPALVALGAEHEEAAGGQRLARFSAISASISSRCFGLGLGRDLDAQAALLLRASVGQRMSRLPPSWMSVPRPAMLVAMVTAPGHAGVGDDEGFLLVVAGVQHLVRDAGRASCRRARTRGLSSSSDSCSDFSIETVPTRIGWPRT